MQFCDRLSQLLIGQEQWLQQLFVLPLEDMGKPIGVADYQLIVPQEELKKVVAEEVKAFGKELPLRTEKEEEEN